MLRVFLWGMLVMSAVLQVLISHQHRDLMQQWQKQDAVRVQLQHEYSRLVLERSTLSAHNRLDQQARKRLQMTEPKQIQVLRK